MTDSLVAFLRARVAEDEQAARIISPGGFAPEVWRAEPVRSGRWMQIVSYERTIDEPPGSEQRASDSPTVLVANNRAEWAHIERWDPARVLAEVAAKRALVNLHSPRPTSGPTVLVGGKWVETTNLDCITCGGEGRLSPSWPCHTIRYLALPYAGHPDYQPEWAPDA